MFDAKALGAEIVTIVRGFVQRAVADLTQRLDGLERKLAEIPAGPRGDRGEKGETGTKGERGEPGERGEKGDQGERGDVGPAGEKGEKGDTGPAGPAGADGRDGKDGEPGPAGPQGEKGEKGDQGEPGARGERGDKGEKGDPGPAGDRGPQGEPGSKGDKGDPGERGEKGMDGRDGRDGKDGSDGKDAAHISPLASIDETRSYPAGTWAKHAGGLWLARSATNGMDGWDCIVEGIAAIGAKQAGDARSFVLSVQTSTGKSVELPFSVPSMIYRGIWREDETYTAGDVVTRDGSTWTAMSDPAGKPGEDGSGWQLSVKRGRDGRDGAKGEKGDRGAEGRAGRDLTQLGSDGSKW